MTDRQRGSVSPLVLASVGLSLATTIGVLRVADAHLGVMAARNAADLTALAAADGIEREDLADLARLNGARLISVTGDGPSVTVTVRSWSATASASAVAASIH